MSEQSPQEHIDARVLAYYGAEFDESDRLVGRSGQGLLEFERTQQIVRDRVGAGSRIIDIGGPSRRLGLRGRCLAVGVHGVGHGDRAIDRVCHHRCPDKQVADA